MRPPVVAALILLLTTPGEALVALQLWTPVVLVIAGAAGTALAVAVSNYRARLQQDQRLAHLETHLPKRSTDPLLVSPPAPPAVSSPPSVSGAPVPVAGSPVAGEVGRDG